MGTKKVEGQQGTAFYGIGAPSPPNWPKLYPRKDLLVFYPVFSIRASNADFIVCPASRPLRTRDAISDPFGIGIVPNVQGREAEEKASDIPEGRVIADRCSVVRNTDYAGRRFIHRRSPCSRKPL